MHAKTVWDVLWSGLMIFVGVLAANMPAKQQTERVPWHRAAGYTVSSLGYICAGIARIAMRPSDCDLFLVLATMVGPLGMVVGLGLFEGTKLSDLFPTFCRRRRSETDNR